MDTPLALALRHARESPPLYYDDDGKILHLYRKPTAERATELVDGIHAVVTSMMDRIKADFPIDNLGVLFTCFDLTRWHEANEAMKKGNGVSHQLLQNHVGAMFRGWKLSRSGLPVFSRLLTNCLRSKGST